MRTLRAHREELEALGIEGLSLFGSVVRGDARPDSDVDIALTVSPERALTLFDVGGIQDRLERLLGTKTDVVLEPVKKPALQREIDRDRVRVF